MNYPFNIVYISLFRKIFGASGLKKTSIHLLYQVTEKQTQVVKGIVHPKIIYSPPSSSKPVWMYLFWTQRKIFWSKFETKLFWGTIDFSIVGKQYCGSQWCPRTALFPTFFRISSFVFRTKTFIRVWNYLRVCTWWQNFDFWMNHPFKKHEKIKHSLLRCEK